MNIQICLKTRNLFGNPATVANACQSIGIYHPKACLHWLACTAILALASATFGQGTYLSSPVGTPAKALRVDDEGKVVILSPMYEGQVLEPCCLLDVSYYIPHSEVKTVAEFTSNAQGQYAGTAVVIGTGGDQGVNAVKIAAVNEGISPGFANPAIAFYTMHNTYRPGSEKERMRITADGKVGMGTSWCRAGLAIRIPDDPAASRWLSLHNYNDNPTWEFMEWGEGSGTFAIRPYLKEASFLINQDGKVGIGTETPEAKLDVAGAIRCQVLQITSDRNKKAGFKPVSPKAILESVLNMPVTSWYFTNAPNVRHIGPMAQDFKAAFDVGTGDENIATVDADGVALISIKALHELLREKETRIASLEQKLAANEHMLTERLDRLEKAILTSSLQAARDEAMPGQY